MLNNYTPREWKESISYELTFDDGHNNGFGFPCDGQGNIPDDLNPAAVENYHYCMAHPDKFVRYNKVLPRISRYVEPAHGTCSCGREVYLWDEYLGGCSCECGRWYNPFGQELNPPETWPDGDDW